MSKSRDAFRTISEVAEWLDTPAHVLRFWESKFTQVKPVKRAGGRRYYRPADMELLGGIKKLLHDEGMTIKGVQKVLREQGVKHVAGMSDPAEEQEAVADAPYIHATEAAKPVPEATVVPFSQLETTLPPAPIVEEPAEISASGSDTDMPDAIPQQPLSEPSENDAVEPPAAEVRSDGSDAEQVGEDPELAQQTTEEDSPANEDAIATVPEDPPSALIPADADAPVADDETASPEFDPDLDQAEDAMAEPDEESVGTLPAFLTEPLQPAESPAPSVTIPQDPDIESIEVAPGVLTALGRLSRLDREQAEQIRPVLARLQELQDRFGKVRS